MNVPRRPRSVQNGATTRRFAFGPPFAGLDPGARRLHRFPPELHWPAASLTRYLLSRGMVAPMNVIDHPFRGQLMARILLAEDDEDMRRFLARALENAGYQVVSFNNGRDAFERLRQEPFHLLLTDIVMPEMDGIELARKASELDPDLKIMFITGFAAVALNPDMQAPRDAKILSKPFHLKDLVGEIGRLIAA
jgi:two-component system cell cycle response regulator CpdR